MSKPKIKKDSKRSGVRPARRNKLAERADAFFNTRTGRGSSRDKTQLVRPGLQTIINSAEAREWYKTNGFVQAIIDAPAEDSTREWIDMSTNFDETNEETGEEGKNISRIIMNRLDELKAKKSTRKLVRNSGIYNQGGFMFIGTKENAPSTEKNLQNPIKDLKKVEFLNVFGPEFGHAQANDLTVTSPRFGRPTMFTLGSGAPGSTDVHESRVVWLVRKFEEQDNFGISTIQTILDAILAQDTALWSSTHLATEMAIKVLKSPEVRNMKKNDIASTIEGMTNQMSTQAMILLRDDEEFDKKTFSMSGMKELFDFIFENLSGMSQVPKSRIMGNSQGVITAGQYDTINYYENVRRFQENDVREILERLISMIVVESEGPVREAMGDQIKQLDWSFKFNPLWVPDPSEQAKINLQNAQADNIYFTVGAKNSDEIRKDRFPELEDFEPDDVEGTDIDPEEVVPDFSPTEAPPIDTNVPVLGAEQVTV